MEKVVVVEGQKNQAGLASLFACAARGDAQVLQNGGLQVRAVGAECCCYEQAGDNPKCPVHGGAKC